MRGEQIKQYRDRLQALAARLGGTVAGLVQDIRRPTGGEAAGGLSNTPLHLGDVGSEVYNQELDTTLLENEAFIRNETLAALERIERGTYGRCEVCDKDIATERLDALPYARHCTPCAARAQSGKAVNLNEGRPDTWLGRPGHEAPNLAGTPVRVVGKDLGGAPGNHHAAGTPGGGSALGGLAGTNVGEGEPEKVNLEEAMGSGNFDVNDEADEDEEAPQAFSGPAGGAVGGTPANKRARGGRHVDDPAGRTAPRGGPRKKRKRK